MEYALHTLVLLAGLSTGERASAKELAAFHDLSAAYVAKFMTRLAKAGIVEGGEGATGGWRLARDPAKISVLDVTDAVEGKAPIFACRNIRADCILFDGRPPRAATTGICTIHAVMRDAETVLRDHLAAQTLADIVARLAANVPQAEPASTAWLRAQSAARRPKGRPKQEQRR